MDDIKNKKEHIITCNNLDKSPGFMPGEKKKLILKGYIL